MALKQQINLFQGGLLRKKDPWSAKRAVAAIVAAICLLLVVSGYAQWRFNRLTRQVKRVETRLAQSGRRFAQLQKRLPPRKKSRLLEQEIQKLKRQKAAKNDLLNRLDRRDANDTAGFSPFLEALAHRHVPGLWLREIFLGGDHVTLAGSARRPAQVPRYLQLLATEEVFRGLQFNQFILGRSKKGYLDFLLKTVPEEKK